MSKDVVITIPCYKRQGGYHLNREGCKIRVAHKISSASLEDVFEAILNASSKESIVCLCNRIKVISNEETFSFFITDVINSLK